MKKIYIKRFSLLLFLLLAPASLTKAADICNSTGSTIRYVNHYTAAAIFFGGYVSVTGWNILNEGECQHIGADNGQQDILLTVQKEGFFYGWNTLKPSDYDIEKSRINAAGGFWKIKPSASYMCVPPEGSFKDKRKWISGEAISGTKCSGDDTLEKNLIVLTSYSTRTMPKISVVLTSNSAYLR